jgi:beta-xylosidase
VTFFTRHPASATMTFLRLFHVAWAICALPSSVIRLEAANPVITDAFTADPAALVHNGTVYLYAGQDEAADKHHGYVMNRWLCYSSTDMVHWKSHGSPLAPKDFDWAKDAAWASHVIERNGKFYWFASVSHADKSGMAIGVAISDSPAGAFKDARGSALVTNGMTPDTRHAWSDIDPAVYIDDNGQAWLFWGNRTCYYAKLKSNMTELDGPVERVPADQVKNYTEAPWIHHAGDLYYLSYATGFPEKMAYSTAARITGPWTYRGLLSEGAFNSNTIHQAIIEFKNQWFFIYHNGARQTPDGGSSFRRSVCIDHLYHNPDGTIRRVAQTTEGTDLSPAKRFAQ